MIPDNDRNIGMRPGPSAAYPRTMPRNASNPNVAYQMPSSAPVAQTQAIPSYPAPQQPQYDQQQYDQSQYAQPMQQQPMQQQPQMQNEFMNMANQYMGANMTPFAQPVFAMGQQVFDQQMAKLQASVSWFSSLRFYFNVSNSYVLNKLKVVVCPFTHKHWKRIDATGADPQSASALQAQGIAPLPAGQLLPPRQDLNAPDLYIPTMAFVTYVLLVAYSLGARNKFTPDAMASTGSSAAMFLLIEVLAIKLAFYLLAGQNPSPPILELAAYSGYKYVGLVISLLVGLLFGSTAFTVANLLGGLMIAIFMMRTMTAIFFPSVVQTGQTKNYYLLAIGLPQIPIVMLLGRWAFA